MIDSRILTIQRRIVRLSTVASGTRVSTLACLWARAVALTAVFALGIACLHASTGFAADTAAPEFGGQCAMSLAQGQHVPTDCSIRWSDKDGKTYCFGSDESKKRFLENPTGNLDRAREFVAAGEVNAVAKSMEYFKSEEVETFVGGVVTDTQAKNGGVFPFADAVTGQNLRLVYDGVDFVRTLAGYGFFADVKFHAEDSPEKKYLVDFWVTPQQGKLSLFDTRIYAAPKRQGTAWVAFTRQPIPWWWIPASEHPGKTEQVRGWEVMSAIEADIVKSRANGIFKLKDDKTGEELNLEFVGVHQPVRRLQQDGRYFACTDFRKQGSTDEYYDIDFWLDDKTGAMSVDQVRVHKVPVRQKNGMWIQVPRYSFDDLKSDVVP